ncbi:MAG: hypothetical protein LBP75_00240 [Planctomycetota bacterium]|jgi:hypothetical protein|nr:hypothetical protein [Planctomycetota bacterium]
MPTVLKQKNVAPVVNPELKRAIKAKLKGFATPFLTKEEGERLRRDINWLYSDGKES